MRQVYGSWMTIRAFQLNKTEDSCQCAILNCSRCGADMQVMLPMGLDNLLDFSTVFGKIHKKCEIDDEE